MSMRNTFGSTTTHDATITITDASNGKITVTYTDTQTAAIKPGDYLYDLKMTDAAGIKTTLLRGTVAVAGGITR